MQASVQYYPSAPHHPMVPLSHGGGMPMMGYDGSGPMREMYPVPYPDVYSVPYLPGAAPYPYVYGYPPVPQPYYVTESVPRPEEAEYGVPAPLSAPFYYMVGAPPQRPAQPQTKRSSEHTSLSSTEIEQDGGFNGVRGFVAPPSIGSRMVAGSPIRMSLPPLACPEIQWGRMPRPQ